MNQETRTERIEAFRKAQHAIAVLVAMFEKDRRFMPVFRELQLVQRALDWCADTYAAPDLTPPLRPPQPEDLA